jgi:hypothetical protein
MVISAVKTFVRGSEMNAFALKIDAAKFGMIQIHSGNNHAPPSEQRTAPEPSEAARSVAAPKQQTVK